MIVKTAYFQRNIYKFVNFPCEFAICLVRGLTCKQLLLLLLDCPKGDFHATVTYEDVVAALAAEVARRLTR